MQKTVYFTLLAFLVSAVVLAQEVPPPSKLLEPLLPVAEAVEKAKSGDPQGYYALAIHYANGREIERNYERAWQFMQKASGMNYSNAVFAAAMCMERMCRMFSGSMRMVRSMSQPPAPLREYTGISMWMPPALTTAYDVVAVRAEYERAINLGVLVATNELARFERRMSNAEAQIRRKAEEAKAKAENEKLAESLLQGLVQSDEEPAHVPSDVFDKKGQTFKWEAGEKEGLTFDVLIRVAPITPTSSYHVIEKATITIDKDGRIIKIEGKPERTRIKG